MASSDRIAARTFDRFELSERLGESAHGELWHARDMDRRDDFLLGLSPSKPTVQRESLEWLRQRVGESPGGLSKDDLKAILDAHKKWVEESPEIRSLTTWAGVPSSDYRFLVAVPLAVLACTRNGDHGLLTMVASSRCSLYHVTGHPPGWQTRNQ